MRRLRVSRLRSLTLTAGSGLFSWSGNNASFVKTKAYILTALGGVFSWIGNNSFLTRQNFLLKANSGSFSIAGSSVNLSRTGGGTIDALTITAEQATPEQIGLYLIPTRSIGSGSVTLRYRVVGAPSFTVGHPLLRISTSGNEAGGPTTIIDSFAGSIFDLTPGTQYDVELTHIEAGQPTKISIPRFTTRSLPPAAAVTGTGTTRTANSVATIGTTFGQVNPGDVLTIADGTYDVSSLTLSRSGTASNPIYIRGTTRTGTTIRDTTGTVLSLNASYIVLENLTIIGSSSDSGTSANSKGIVVGGTRTNITVRNLTMTGVDQAVVDDNSGGSMTGALVYNCTLAGNNAWDATNMGTPPNGSAPGLTWNDDGLRLPGLGNAAWNNTLSGFGDSFAVIAGVRCEGIYFYRNKIDWTGDDSFEGDYSTRNIGFYDNLITNCGTLLSLDPVYGGPLYCFRNVMINSTRGPWKFTTTNTGYLVYNNTIVRTDGLNSGWAALQFNNGAQSNYSYRNNLLLWQGAGTAIQAIESAGHNPVDFTNNAYYPNGSFWWTNSGGTWGSLAAAQSGVPNTTPVFGSATKRMTNDIILSSSNPFSIAINIGATHLTKYIGNTDASLAVGSNARNAGIAISGITDNFSGAAPDIGAVITGRTAVTHGDSTLQLIADATNTYLKQSDGTPFPILGRTAWCLISVTMADARTFIDDCAAKGYNCIEVAFPHHWSFTNQPPYANNGAALPFTLNTSGGAYTGSLNAGSSSPDFTTMNPAYWSHADAIIDYAASRGIVVAVFPCYVGNQDPTPDEGWLQEMVQNGTTKMQTYGATLAARWANRPNIIWMLAGDWGSDGFPFTTAEQNVVNAFTTGLLSVTKLANLYSAEPYTETSSSDINATVASNAINLEGIYSHIGTSIISQGRSNYGGSHGPTYLIEEPYDQEGSDGNNFNPNATQPVRRFQYWGWLVSRGGYISGNGYVWQFNPGEWNLASHLNSAGAQDMARLNAFIKSIEWWRLVPNTVGGIGTLITAGGGTVDASNYVAAAATTAKDLLIAYVPPAHSGSVTIDMTKLQGDTTARWFDPTNGSYTAIGTFANTGTRAFTIPGNNSAGQGDWVLRLDAPVASSSLPAWVSALALNTWTQLTGTAPSLVGAADPVTAGYSGGTYDPVRRNFIFFGGGHNDSGDNGVYAARMGRDVPDVVVLKTKSATTQGNVPHYSDGTPSARHTYNSIVYHALDDCMMTIGAASVFLPGGDGRWPDCDRFRLNTNAWDAADTVPDLPGSTSGTNYDYDMDAAADASGNVYVTIWGGSRLMKWTRASNSWSQLSSNAIRAGALVFDPVRSRLIHFGNGGFPQYWTLAGAQTSITFSGAQASQGPQQSWVYRPDNDTFLGFNSSSGTVLQCTPAFAVTTYAVAGTSPPRGTSVTDAYSKWQIDTTLGIVMCINSWATQNVYAFRYK